MTLYDELGVTPAASTDEINRAHRGLARLLHPDHIHDEELRHLAEEQLKRVNAIHHVLADPARRRDYDQQLLAHHQHHKSPPPPPPPRPSRSAVLRPLTLAALCLAAGYQSAWWAAAGSRPAAGGGLPAPSAIASSSTPSDGRPEWEQLQAENRELRQALRLALAERGRQTAARPAGQTAAAAAVVPAPVPAPTASASVTSLEVVAAANPAPVLPKPAAPESSPEQPKQWGGTWIYRQPADRPVPPGDQYPAEYIELVLMERDEALIGRYRGRYKVVDRDIEPEIEFFFEGPARAGQPASAAGNSARFPWRASGGAKGEVSLRLQPDRTLAIEWYTSQLGRTLTLGSGSAVLVRREDNR